MSGIHKLDCPSGITWGRMESMRFWAVGSGDSGHPVGTRNPRFTGICKGEGLSIYMQRNVNKPCEEDCCKLRVFEKTTLKSGVVIEDTEVGEGRQARQGMSVDVAYEAFVLRDDGLETDRWSEDRWGEAIDRATARDPFGFVVGSAEVIQGLSQGVIGMRPGGHRHIVVPNCYARNTYLETPLKPQVLGSKVHLGSKVRFDIQLLKLDVREHLRVGSASTRR